MRAPDVEWNANQQNGYTKFFPNTTRHMMVRGRLTGMNINSSGFRSRYDFQNPKPPGVLRIATLGGSSTFGYEEEDEETYPYILEQTLRTWYPGRRIEVLNLGIPQLRMENIAPECPGTFEGSAEIIETTLIGTYRGKDCEGDVTGGRLELHVR